MLSSVFGRFLHSVHRMHRIHAYEDRDDQSNEKIGFSRKHLRRLVCETSCFNKREVFGVTEVKNGSMTKNTFLSDGTSVTCYEWPKHRIHSKARDTHSLLNLRFPVPDDKVLWTIQWEGADYRPNFAVEADEIEYISPVFEDRNPCGRCDD